MKWVFVLLFVACAVHVHLRGRVRHRLGRQLLDHSTFMAPINVLMYAFSRVPTTPFLDDPGRHFPELEPLRANWPAIRDEARRLRELQHIKAADGYTDVGFNSFFRRGWKRFYLKWYDDAHPSAAQLCPVTTGLLRDIPSVKAAMFTELPPGSELRPHRDPYAGSLRLHLGLETPNDEGCFIEVDGQRYSWRDGQWTMFDETFIHRARNDTQSNRIILFCDVERPLRLAPVRAINRFVARHLIAAGASPNVEGDRTGGFNRLFKHFYALRLKAKGLRERNQSLYYGLKYTAVALVAAFIVWI
ncbi:aspartyl/asparaginyl beta-hydroxylase domain-containing protein [Lysobacter sp. LF1]|uniref:Aspartyl/asparaginyl beta-hydroxylase domain-containing protein n=1 Tax=Lysobacter stagni TaxID=3045172 RepID=A0ABT6XFG0_9GAMM|nr:aspartyl/asparaginyl beta-hydroxylase domain-containing protein [Lysobacter sp. LF1]MDI9238789.1 aspartyl/asparaginyl beta-hydroxylase domain-containing protein [Lysobacter sp. LF1]